MIYKTLLLLLLSFAHSLGAIQEVRIGSIDDYYSNKIDKTELKNIIDEIEYTFLNNSEIFCHRKVKDYFILKRF